MPYYLIHCPEDGRYYLVRARRSGPDVTVFSHRWRWLTEARAWVMGYEWFDAGSC